MLGEFLPLYSEVPHHFVACKHLLIYHVDKYIDPAVQKHLENLKDVCYVI